MVRVNLHYINDGVVSFQCKDETSESMRDVAVDVVQGSGFIIPADGGDIYVAPSSYLLYVEVVDDGHED